METTKLLDLLPFMLFFTQTKRLFDTIKNYCQLKLKIKKALSSHIKILRFRYKHPHYLFNFFFKYE